MKILTRILGFMLLAGCVLGLWWAWNFESMLVDVASVSRGSFVESIQVEGVTKARHRRTILAPVSGVLVERRWTSGQPIEVGKSILATIEPSLPPLLDKRSHAVIEANIRAAEAELERAKSSRDVAESNLKLAQKRKPSSIVQNGITRPATPENDPEEQARKQELQVMERNCERAEYALEALRAQLDGSLPKLTGSRAKETKVQGEVEPDDVSRPRPEVCEVISPIDGHILQQIRSESGVVAAGTPLLEIGNLDQLDYEFDVLSSEAVKLQLEQTVQISPFGREDHKIQGRIHQIDRIAMQRISPLGVVEHRVRFKARAISELEPTKDIGDGYRIEGRIQVREEPDVLKVPVSALIRVKGAWSVFRVQNGVARSTEVKLGAKNESEASILSGLEANDLVVLYPADRIREGMSLRIR